jgi:hypothetical protein
MTILASHPMMPPMMMDTMKPMIHALPCEKWNHLSRTAGTPPDHPVRP